MPLSHPSHPCEAASATAHISSRLGRQPAFFILPSQCTACWHRELAARGGRTAADQDARACGQLRCCHRSWGQHGQSSCPRDRDFNQPFSSRPQPRLRVRQMHHPHRQCCWLPRCSETHHQACLRDPHSRRPSPQASSRAPTPTPACHAALILHATPTSTWQAHASTAAALAAAAAVAVRASSAAAICSVACHTARDRCKHAAIRHTNGIQQPTAWLATWEWCHESCKLAAGPSAATVTTTSSPADAQYTLHAHSNSAVELTQYEHLIQHRASGHVHNSWPPAWTRVWDGRHAAQSWTVATCTGGDGSARNPGRGCHWPWGGHASAAQVDV
mmetsp:Transcript_13035/g.23009  ORF Transcript_13035/g.23009 Transcript_13035/m.23009 type:complete len:331 (-) Transcript_13035:112-1104(-)